MLSLGITPQLFDKLLSDKLQFVDSLPMPCSRSLSRELTDKLKFVGLSVYSIISAPVPAPTVRPPSRIANLSPFSIAIGAINSITNPELSPGITISTPSFNVATPVTSVVRKKNCGRYPLKNGVCLPPSSFVSTYTSALNFVCGVIDPGFEITCPLSISFLSTPRSSKPTLSPAIPEPNSFLNISTPAPPFFPAGFFPLFPPSPPPLPPPPLPALARSSPSPPSHAPKSKRYPPPASKTACLSRAPAAVCSCPQLPSAPLSPSPRLPLRSAPAMRSLGLSESRHQETDSSTAALSLPTPPNLKARDHQPHHTCS